MFNVYDDNNNKIKCEVLFTFSDSGKNFIVYKDEEGEVLASYYETYKDKIVVLPITSDKDYNLVDKKLSEWGENSE